MTTQIGGTAQSGMPSLVGELGLGPLATMNPTLGKIADPLGVGNALFGKEIFHPDPLSSQLANLSWSQWQQASDAMYGTANQLISYATDPNYIAEQRGLAQADADAGFATQQRGLQQELGLMGVTPTAVQAAAMAKSAALGKAEAEAGAMNQAAQGAAQLQQGVLRGGL